MTEDGFCLWNIKNLVTELDKEHRILGWKGDQCFLLKLLCFWFRLIFTFIFWRRGGGRGSV